MLRLGLIFRVALPPDNCPTQALKLFKSITSRVRQFSDAKVVANSRLDTSAFNNALNGYDNLGDEQMFLQLFDEMPEYGAELDILTYNIVIKLCAKYDRKDLLVFVLRRVIQKGIPLCMTTLHSLVATYDGFGHLEKTEKMVQAMREERRDL